MDITEAVNKRKTYRGFKPDPVPQEILRELMELALRAPSWANTQPWEFAIVTGKRLEEIRQGFAQKAAEEPHPDLAFPRVFPEPYLSRLPAMRRGPDAARRREDKELRKEMRLQGSRLYGVPCVIYIHTDRSFYLQQGESVNVYAVFDCGLIAENIMLLAVKYGLGTVPAAQAVMYPDVLRRVLGLPDSRLIVLGIGIGYPDMSQPQSQVYSTREPLDKVAKWYGFD
jgi:nitroreductase